MTSNLQKLRGKINDLISSYLQLTYQELIAHHGNINICLDQLEKSLQNKKIQNLENNYHEDHPTQQVDLDGPRLKDGTPLNRGSFSIPRSHKIPETKGTEQKDFEQVFQLKFAIDKATKETKGRILRREGIPRSLETKLRNLKQKYKEVTGKSWDWEDQEKKYLDKQRPHESRFRDNFFTIQDMQEMKEQIYLSAEKNAIEALDKAVEQAVAVTVAKVEELTKENLRLKKGIMEAKELG